MIFSIWEKNNIFWSHILLLFFKRWKSLIMGRAWLSKRISPGTSKTDFLHLHENLFLLQWFSTAKCLLLSRYAKHFTLLPCEWNCFYFDWQERKGDHDLGRNPSTCPHPQCGIVHFNHFSETNRHHFFRKVNRQFSWPRFRSSLFFQLREGIKEIQPHYFHYCAIDNRNLEITKGLTDLTYDEDKRLSE